MSDRLTMAIDAGTGSCRAALFDEAGRQVALAQREWSHPAAPGVPGSQVFDTDRNWRLIGDCTREALDPRRRFGGARRGRRQHEHARRDGPLRRGRPGDLGLPERRFAGVRRRPANWSGRAGPRRIYEPAGDWVSITAPARLLWLATTRAGALEPDRPRDDALRLDPVPALRRPRHRPLDRLQLRHVRPGAPDLVGGDRRPLRDCDRRSCRRSRSRARSWRPSRVGRRPRRA